MSAGCGLVTAPILWLQFGYLPLLGVPANALAEPAMPVLLGLAFVTAGLDARAAVGCGGRRMAERLGRAYIALCAHVIGSLPFAEIKSTRALAGLTAAILLVVVGRRIVRARPARAP